MNASFLFYSFFFLGGGGIEKINGRDKSLSPWGRELAIEKRIWTLFLHFRSILPNPHDWLSLAFGQVLILQTILSHRKGFICKAGRSNRKDYILSTARINMWWSYDIFFALNRRSEAFFRETHLLLQALHYDWSGSRWDWSSSLEHCRMQRGLSSSGFKLKKWGFSS